MNLTKSLCCKWNEQIRNAQAAACVKDKLCHQAIGMPLLPSLFWPWELCLQKTHWLRLFMNCTIPWLHMSKTVFKTHVVHEFWLSQPQTVTWGPRSCGHHCILQLHLRLLLPSSPQTKQDSKEWSPRLTQSGLVIICVVRYCGWAVKPSRLAGRLLGLLDTTLLSSLALRGEVEPSWRPRSTSVARSDWTSVFEGHSTSNLQYFH